MKKFAVFVYTQGQVDYEFVKDFDKEEDAVEFVNKARDRRDNEYQNESEYMKKHFTNLEWIITRL